MHYVIAYDVQDDRQRDRLAHLLLDYGERVQKSVFEADLTADELQELLGLAAEHLGEEDSLRAYPLCRDCRRGVSSLGRELSPASEGLRIV